MSTTSIIIIIHHPNTFLGPFHVCTTAIGLVTRVLLTFSSHKMVVFVALQGVWCLVPGGEKQGVKHTDQR